MNENHYHSLPMRSIPRQIEGGPLSEAQHGAAPRPGRACVSPHAIPRIDSATLLGNGAELIIVHGQREYRLRVTSNGKLILTA
jgi:hemin uptake protein HemP